jgi:cytochrome c1
MTRQARVIAVAALMVAASLVTAKAAETEPPPRVKWSFSGPFGSYDVGQLQRGLKIYHEVCKACHGLTLVSFRNLAEPGGPGLASAQAAAIAADYQVTDGPNEQGAMFQRAARLADYFPSPFPNDAAARSANNGVLPPDLSVIAKARTYERGLPWFIFDIFTQYQEEGVDYLVALLTGYEDAPSGFTLLPGLNYNKYFPGNAIGMPKILNDGQVAYTDGTPQTADQYAKDIAAFLMWAAEPHMEARKRIGFQVMVVLIVFAGLLYFTKKKVWSTVEGHA